MGNCMREPKDFTIPEVAERLGISRVAAWNRVKRGEIPATRVGRQFIVSNYDAQVAAGEVLSPERRKWLEEAVDRVVREYGPVLKRLSRE